jgi:hypothetical protein
MIRARRGHAGDPVTPGSEYATLRDAFHVSPPLERYLEEEG